MRTTLNIPDREHTLFISLARQEGISFSRMVVDLALRGLAAPSAVAESQAKYTIDEETGLPVFRSGRPVTIDDVRALEDEE